MTLSIVAKSISDTMPLELIPAEILAEVEKEAAAQKDASEVKKLQTVIREVDCAIDQYGQFVLQTVVGQRSEVLLLDSLAGQDAVRAVVKSAYGALPKNALLEQITSEIRMAARASGKRIITYQRVSSVNGNFFIDLGDPTGNVIHIKNGHWQIINNARFPFIRPMSYGALTLPARSKSARHAFILLWNFLLKLGIPKSRTPLVIATLICWMRGGVTYPVLSLYGPAGSGKTTAGMVLLKLIDPPAKDQIPIIKQEEQHLAAAAQVRHVLSIDNASKFSAEFQNMLCTCSTGGEILQRRLYTNGEVAFLPIHRPVLITSVNPVVTRPDLLTRTVSVEFQSIDQRIDVDSLVKEFQTQADDLIGALVELVAVSTLPLACEDSQGNRLHDFCIAGQRVFAAIGFDPFRFMKFVDVMRASTGEEIAAGDHFVVALRKVLNMQREKATDGEQLPGWKSWFPNQATSVITSNSFCVVGIRPQHLVNKMGASPIHQRYQDWIPGNVRELSGALMRVIPILHDIGIKVAKREPSTGNSYWEFVFDTLRGSDES